MKPGPRPKYIICTVDGCQNKHYALSYCSSHYDKLRRWGVPEREKFKCAYELCDRIAGYKEGMLCRSHHHQVYLGMELKPIREQRKIVEGYLQCKTCGWQPLDNFYKRSNGISYQNECKACVYKRWRRNLLARTGVQEDE